MVIQSVKQFHQFSNLPPELRNHTLTFAEPKSLWNYSQCSNQCNAEVQKLRTNAPFGIWIQEGTNGFMMSLGYSKSNVVPDPCKDESLNYVRGPAKFDEDVTYDEAMEIVEDHIIRAFKYVKERTTRHMSLLMDKWPAKLMSSGLITELDFLHVLIRDTMLDKFVEFAKSTKTRVKELQMLDWSRSKPISIDKEKMKQVFETEFFKQAQNVNINVSCDIDDEDFLGFKNPKIILPVKNRRINDDAIRQKVAQINDSPLEHKIRIRIPNEDPHPFNLEELFPPRDPDVEYLRWDTCQIGNVYVKDCGRWKIEIFNRFRE